MSTTSTPATPTVEYARRVALRMGVLGYNPSTIDEGLAKARETNPACPAKVTDIEICCHYDVRGISAEDLLVRVASNAAMIITSIETNGQPPEAHTARLLELNAKIQRILD